MEAQLRLINTPVPVGPPVSPQGSAPDEPVDDTPALEAGPVAWRLSPSTRERGRRGIEHARAALQQARSATAA